MTDRASPPRRSKARSFGAVALGGAVMAVVIGAVLVSLYVRFIRYERVAARHAPAGTTIALRLEVEQAPVYEPVRRHLLPLLGGTSTTPAEGDARLQRLEKHSGLERADLREIVLAVRDGAGDWVLVFGGIFGASPGNAVLGEALRAEWSGFRPAPDGAVFVDAASEIAVARASDGVVLVGSSERIVRDALVTSARYDALGLPARGPGGGAADGAGVRALGAALESKMPELQGIFAGLTRATAELELGERMTVHLHLFGDAPSDTERAASAIVAAMKRGARDERGSAGSVLGAAADRAVVAHPDGRTTDVGLTWEREEVDQGMALVARAIREAFPP